MASTSPQELYQVQPQASYQIVLTTMAFCRTAVLVVVLACVLALSVGAPADNQEQLAVSQKAPKETLKTANSYGYGYGYGGLYGYPYYGYGGYGGYYGGYGYPYYGYGYGHLYGYYPGYYW